MMAPGVVYPVSRFTAAEYERHRENHHRWYTEQKQLYPDVEPEDGTWAALAIIAAPIGGMIIVFMLGGGIYLCTVGGIVPGVFIIAISLVPVVTWGLSEIYNRRRLRQNVIAAMGLCFKCSCVMSHDGRYSYTPGRGLKYHNKCPKISIVRKLKGFLAIVPPEEDDSSDDLSE